MVTTASTNNAAADSVDLSGIYVISSADPAAGGRCLDADGNSPKVDGTKVQLWMPNGTPHQKWKLERIANTDNYYSIVSLWHNLETGYLDADGYGLGTPGTKVQLWTSNGLPHQQWQINPIGDDTYRIICASPRAKQVKFLDAHGHQVGINGGAIQLWPDNGAVRNQLWKLEKTSR
ncbi:RICIN domain-containing protein [Leptothoe sp. LEGE 181152]|nr:RICIN domain-containing protein [Leptothoe sp. LEGE 181152]